MRSSMAASKVNRAERALIDSLMDVYAQQTSHISLFKDQLLMAISNATRLTQHIHSIRSRLKDPTHLKDKIARKLLKCKAEGIAFDLTPENLLVKVNDLAGVRVLHLYTRQIREIDKALREIFAESQYRVCLSNQSHR
jgi:GTP pyrophosphokinase